MAKRVCMVAYTHYRSDARPRREAQALVARGDQVDFLSLGEGASRRENMVGGVNVIELPARRYRGGNSLSYLVSYLWFFARALARLTRRHLKRRYDVIHVHTLPDFMVFTAIFAKAMGAKVVLDVHDTMPELYQSKFATHKGHPLIRLLRLQERLACAFADRVICVHEPHLMLLASRGVRRDKLTAVLNVPDPEIFGPPRPPIAYRPPPRLVYHGTVAARLGLDVALHAFARVLATHQDARFDIIGTGDDAARIHALISKLGLSEAVRFTDQRFAVSEIPRLLCDANIGIIPNRDDPATRMMLPVKLLEYLHLGIPAVAPRSPVIMHYFAEGDLAYYTPGDAESLARAITRLIEIPTTSAAEFSRRYQWDTHKHDLYRAIDGD